MEGWIKIHRKMQDSGIWQKPSDWLKVWMYILLNVNHKDNCVSERGERLFNYREMTLFIGVKYSTIDNFIRWAKSTRLITTRKTTRGVFVKVLNYDVYQDDTKKNNDTKNDTDYEMRTKSKRNRNDTINKNEKNERMKEKLSSEKSVSSGFKKPTLTDITEHMKTKNHPEEAENFFNFYESKGWMVGKNKMKLWKSAASGWISRKFPGESNKMNGITADEFKEKVEKKELSHEEIYDFFKNTLKKEKPAVSTVSILRAKGRWDEAFHYEEKAKQEHIDSIKNLNI